MVFSRLIAIMLFTLAGLIAPGSPSEAQGLVCRETGNGTALDFWVGRWRVVDPTTFADYGTNTITRLLNGCAVEENWRGIDGLEAKSLFYFDAPNGRWEQVWVTTDTSRLGGLKVKSQLTDFDGVGVQFQGILSSIDGRPVLDRTTLRALGDGRIRQLIEQSSDGGTTWITIFDALYLPLGR